MNNKVSFILFRRVYYTKFRKNDSQLSEIDKFHENDTKTKTKASFDLGFVTSKNWVVKVRPCSPFTPSPKPAVITK